EGGMTRRFSLLRLVSLAALIAGVAIIVILARGSGSHTGSSALETQNGGGAGGPLAPGEPLSFGLVTTKNVSSDPIQLVSARLLWLDAGLKLLGFSASTDHGAAITAREWPVANSVPLDQVPPLAPEAKDDQVTLLFGLTVEPGREGKALGVVVKYRQNGKLKEQLFKQQAFVCAVPVLDPKANCPGHASDFDMAKDFDDELKARRRKGGSPAD